MKKIILFCFISLLICSCKNNDAENKVITQLSLSQTQTQLAQGDSLSLTLSYTPADSPAPTCTWTSSDTTVARVDNKGKIKTMGRGMATITVATVKTDASGLVISAQCKLTVTYKGDGSASNPYLIYTAADLKAIRDSINTKNGVYGNKAYKLMNDLDFSKETGDWTPIGDTTTVAFKGVFDGNRKTIKGVRIGSYGFRKNIQYAGFFGVINGAEIKNLGVAWNYIWTNPLTKNSNYYIGCIAAYGSGNITDCSSSGIFCSFADMCYDGGIIGYGCATTNVTNCHYETGTVSSTNYQEQIQYCAGGIAGYISGTISNCYSKGFGNSAYKYKGSIAGYSIGTIVNCYCTNGTNFYLAPECISGGIAGYSKGIIINCYSSEEVEGVYAGGIVGQGEDITNCYSSGNIYGVALLSAPEYAGGIAGISTNINNCIALNRKIAGFLNSTPILSNVHLARICCLFSASGTAKNNYASPSLVVKMNYRTDATVTDFSDTKLHGLDLTAQPVDLLNAYVSANPTFNNIGLKKWKVTAGANNGYPVLE